MLYEKDFLAWTQQQSELLRQGRWQEVDLDHLVQELDGMGQSNHRELESRLVVLIAHLLKWEFQLNQLQDQWKEFDGRSWRKTIILQRIQIERLMEDCPRLELFTSLLHLFCVKNHFSESILVTVVRDGKSIKTIIIS